MSNTTHSVEFGETLQDIAQKYYGDPARAAEIADANGLDVDQFLMTGMLLDIPDAESTGFDEIPPTHIVGPFDTLVDISLMYFGMPDMASAIAQLNGLPEDAFLMQGLELKLPVEEGPPPPPPAPEPTDHPGATYTVGPDQSLEDIAQELFGDPSMAVAIAQANNLSVGQFLMQGLVLDIPFELLDSTTIIDASPSQVTIELNVATLPFVKVPLKELIFPGTTSDIHPVSGKWLYALHDGEFAFSVDIVNEGEWWVTRAASPGAECVTDGMLTLSVDGTYEFLLSPVLLSDGAIDRLVKNREQCRWLTYAGDAGKMAVAKEPVLVRDPCEWAEVYADKYREALNPYREWVYNEERAAELFIASTLKSIIESGDDASIADNLEPGQPDTFLDTYNRDEQALREKLEVAAFNIASLVDSEDHRIIEQGFVERGQTGVELLFLHLATVLKDLGECVEGRRLLHVIVNDAESVPNQYLFSESSQLDFSKSRFLYLGGVALLKDLMPAWAASSLRYSDEVAKDMVSMFFEEKANQKPRFVEIEKAWVRLGKNAEVIREARMNPPPSNRQVRQLQQGLHGKKTWRKLFVEWEALDAKFRIPTKAPRGVIASARFLESIEGRLSKIVVPVGALIEVINLTTALNGAITKKGSLKEEEMIGLLGTSMDFTLMLREVLVAMGKIAEKTGMAAFGVVGIISGVCDGYAFWSSIRRASERYDRDQAFGHGVALAGAGCVIGSGLIFVYTGLAATGLEAIALGALGGLIGIIGAVLIGVGTAIAIACTDNAYEQFATHSFLGKAKGNERVPFSWSPHDLPTKEKRKLELEALMCLLANFQLEASRHDFTITPGYVNSDQVFVIYAEKRYYNYDTNHCLFYVNMADGSVFQHGGDRPVDASGVHVERDQHGRVKRFKISVDEASVPYGAPALQHSRVEVWARLNLGNGHSNPPTYLGVSPEGAEGLPWLRGSFPSGVFGTDYSGSSLDSGLHEDVVATGIERWINAVQSGRRG